MAQVFESSSRSVRDRRRVTVGRRTSSRVFRAFSKSLGPSRSLSGLLEVSRGALRSRRVSGAFEIESRLLVGQGSLIGCRGRLSPPFGPGSDNAEGR